MLHSVDDRTCVFLPSIVAGCLGWKMTSAYCPHGCQGRSKLPYICTKELFRWRLHDSCRGTSILIECVIIGAGRVILSMVPEDFRTSSLEFIWYDSLCSAGFPGEGEAMVSVKFREPSRSGCVGDCVGCDNEGVSGW